MSLTKRASAAVQDFYSHNPETSPDLHGDMAAFLDNAETSITSDFVIRRHLQQQYQDGLLVDSPIQQVLDGANGTYADLINADNDGNGPFNRAWPTSLVSDIAKKLVKFWKSEKMPEVPTSKQVTTWLTSPKDIQRSTCFKLALLLQMPNATMNRLLLANNESPLNLRNPEEVIISFCVNNHRGWADEQRLLNEYLQGCLPAQMADYLLHHFLRKSDAGTANQKRLLEVASMKSDPKKSFKNALSGLEAQTGKQGEQLADVITAYMKIKAPHFSLTAEKMKSFLSGENSLSKSELTTLAENLPWSDAEKEEFLGKYVAAMGQGDPLLDGTRAVQELVSSTANEEIPPFKKEEELLAFLKKHSFDLVGYSKTNARRLQQLVRWDFLCYSVEEDDTNSADLKGALTSLKERIDYILLDGYTLEPPEPDPNADTIGLAEGSITLGYRQMYTDVSNVISNSSKDAIVGNAVTRRSVLILLLFFYIAYRAYLQSSRDWTETVHACNIDVWKAELDAKPEHSDMVEHSVDRNRVGRLLLTKFLENPESVTAFASAEAGAPETEINKIMNEYISALNEVSTETEDAADGIVYDDANIQAVNSALKSFGMPPLHPAYYFDRFALLVLKASDPREVFYEMFPQWDDE